MKDIEELKKNLDGVGLSEKEISVYLALFELGGRGFPSVIAKQVRLNRSTTYKILGNLSIKGLVGETEKSKKRYFILNKPEKLVSFIEYQNKELHHKLQNIRKIAPGLTSIFSRLSSMPKVFFYEGKKQVALIYKDMVSYKNYENLAFFNAAEVENFWNASDLTKFVKDKEKQNIKTRVISPDTKENRTYGARIYGHVSERFRPDTRYISSEILSFDCEMSLYGKDKIAIFNMNINSIDKQMVGVVVEDLAIYNMMKTIFELAWIGAQESNQS